jgi:hypothetical protein
LIPLPSWRYKITATQRASGFFRGLFNGSQEEYLLEMN